MTGRSYYPTRLSRSGGKPPAKRLTKREIESWEEDNLCVEIDAMTAIANDITHIIDPLKLPKEVVKLDQAYSGRTIRTTRWLQQSILLQQLEGGMNPPKDILN